MRFYFSSVQLIFLLFFLLNLLILKSQSNLDTSLVIRHLNISNGMPSNLVTDVNYDKNGFLWITSQAGISRYDGSKIVNYSSFNFPGIINNRFHKINKDNNGNLIFINGANDFYRSNTNSELIIDSTLIWGVNCINNGNGDLIIKDSNPCLFSHYNNLNRKSSNYFYFDISRNDFYFIFDYKVFFNNKEVDVNNSSFIFDYNKFFVVNKKLVLINLNKELVIINKEKVESVVCLERILDRKIDLRDIKFLKKNNVITMRIGNDLFEVICHSNNFQFRQINTYSLIKYKFDYLKYEYTKDLNIFYSAHNGVFITQSNQFKCKNTSNCELNNNEVHRIIVENLMPLSIYSKQFQKYKFISNNSIALNLSNDVLCFINQDSVYYISKKKIQKYKLVNKDNVHQYKDAFRHGNDIYVIGDNKLFRLHRNNYLIKVLESPCIILSALKIKGNNDWLLAVQREGLIYYNSNKDCFSYFNEFK